MTSRRAFLTGLGAIIAAPAIVRASSLMGLPRAPTEMYGRSAGSMTMEDWAALMDAHIKRYVAEIARAQDDLFLFGTVSSDSFPGLLAFA